MKPPPPPLCCRRLIVVLGMLVSLIGLACDDSSNDIPQAVRDQQARQAEAEKKLPKIPTTQELLTGPRSVTALGPLPMTMRVPASWKVEVAGPASHLRGVSPSGQETTIQLTSRSPVKRAEFEAFVKSAKKDQAEKPQSIIKADLRPFGNAQLFEWQKVGEPREWPVSELVGGQMRTRTTTEQSFDWKISLFAPQGDGFQRYELSFIGLTKSQYDKDKSFLQGILDTLNWVDSTAVPAATTVPSRASPSPATLP
jgi:hypothetical protein